MLRLLFLFTVVPAFELYLLFQVAGRIGGATTVAICLVTGIVGARLARSQGGGVLRRMQEATQRGQIPARELVDGALILVAGVLLITPGMVTDAFGLLLLLPPTRAVFRRALVQWAKARMVARVQGADGTWTEVRRGADPRGPGSPAGFRFEVGGSPRPADAEWRAEVQPARDDQEILPPGTGPRRPRRRRPAIIDAEVVDDDPGK